VFVTPGKELGASFYKQFLKKQQEQKIHIPFLKMTALLQKQGQEGRQESKII